MSPSPGSVTQEEKAQRFRALHERDGAFIIPNPFDVGTARLLAHLGFEALATTSAGYAFTLGYKDGGLTREQALAGARAIATATDLPVSADLEHGFGDAPEAAAEAIRLAAAAEVVGGSIEDATGRADSPIYEIEHAAERVRAATEAVRALPFPFTLTARAENYLHGRSDIHDTIKRLQAFEAAGADVLYAPGLYDLATIKTVVSAIKTIVANASDSVGVASVQIQLDGMNLGNAMSSPPYSLAWDTRTASNSCHQLTAIARNSAGNTGTTSIFVQVSNP